MIYIITALLFCLLITVGYILYLKFFKKYTRERFAFTGLALIGSLVLTIILQIYSSEGYISAVIQISNATFGTNLSTYQTDWKDHALTVVLMALLVRYVLSIHTSWDGPISEQTFVKNRFNEHSSLMEEAILQLNAIIKNKKIIAHVEDEKLNQSSIFTTADQEKLPWHIQVYELLTFSSEQYKFDREKDFYERDSSYVGFYGRDRKFKIAILCSKEIPTIHKLRSFVANMTRTHKGIGEFMVAVKDLGNHQRKITISETEITFIDEMAMLDNLADFQSYFELIVQRYTKDKVTEGGTHALQDIYVPIRGHDMEVNSLGQLDRYLTDWASSDFDNKHLAILGEYGCGKSVLSLKVAFQMVQDVKHGGRIPILIELRGKSPRTLNVSEILSTWAQDYHISPASLMKLHKAGKLVLIFEGFDEMDMIGDREMRLAHFQRLWEFATPKAKIIITGRPNFFLDDKELKTSLGIEKSFEGSHYCQAIYLEKFNPDEIRLAIRNVEETTRQQVLSILERDDSRNFYDLVSRPAILYLVAVIWKERELSNMSDKINSALIIREFILYSYSRQTSKRTSFPLSESEREYFMNGVAVGMLSRTKYTNQLAKNELLYIVNQLYNHIPNEVSEITKGLEGKRKPLKSRLMDGKAEETIMTDVRSCGILVNDLTRRDYFKFAHKSFLEYQVSLYFVESLLQDRGTMNIVMNAISKALGVSINNFGHSKETMTFISEILVSRLKIDTSEEPEAVARKLFKVIYPIKWLSCYPRLVAWLSSLLLVLTALTIQLFSFVILGKDNSHKELNSIIGSSFIFINVTILFLMLVIRTRMRRLTRFNVVWVQACMQLNIRRKTLKKIIPKAYCKYLESGAHSPFYIYAMDGFTKIVARRPIWRRFGRSQKSSKITFGT